MVIRFQDELRRLNDLGLLEGLLADKTTGGNILWGTDAYSELGPDYQRDEEIQVPLITGDHAGLIKNRAAKALEQQFERTKAHAEVFTPMWVCAKMNDYADEEWFGGGEKSWQQYVDSRRMEPTCGEAPFLVSRYDVTTGESIPLEERTGILDRKLRAVDKNAETEEAWLKWALRAFQATYGYAVSSACYGVLTESLKEAKLAHEERLQVERECEQMIRIIRECRLELERLTAEYLLSYTSQFQSAFDSIKTALAIGDVDGFIQGANSISEAAGRKAQFNSISEFDAIMAGDIAFKL